MTNKIAAAGCLFWLACLAAAAADIPARPNEKILSEVRVYHWGTRGWTVGQKIKMITESHDELGRPVLVEFNDGENQPLERTEITYTKTGAEKTVFDPAGRPIRRSAVKRSGSTETETVRDAAGAVLFLYRRTLGPGGRLKQSTRLTPAGNSLFVSTYAYDGEGRLESVTVANPDGSPAVIISYRYLEFDKAGRWRTRAEYFSYADVASRPHEIVTRSRAVADKE